MVDWRHVVTPGQRFGHHLPGVHVAGCSHWASLLASGSAQQRGWSRAGTEMTLKGLARQMERWRWAGADWSPRPSSLSVAFWPSVREARAARRWEPRELAWQPTMPNAPCWFLRACSVRLMPLIRGGLLAALLVASLAACSGDEGSDPARTTARTSFEVNPQGERVFEAYRQTGTASKELTLPKGTMEVGVNLDCAGSQGTLEVELSTAGSAGVDCTTSSGRRGGIVNLAGDGSPLERKQTITITGPGDQEWSVAIDAVPAITTS